MIVCPTCGAHNDPGNHFCDQCGTRLENAQTTAASSTETAAEQPSVPTPSAPSPSPTCPNCGAAVMLGQAFCDECGYPLNQVYSEYTASDAPTMVAPPDLQPVAPTVDVDTAASAEPIESDQPATLAAPPVETEVPALDPLPISEPEPVADDEPPVDVAAEPMAPTAPTLPEESESEQPVESLPEPEESQELPVELQPEPGEPEPAVHTTTVVTPEPTAPAATSVPSEEERRRLEDLITVHRDTVTQYEQMLQRYPAGAAPAFLTAGLDEARNALAQAEADLADLPTGPDPAEITRLESLITAHRDTVTQYEQMLQRYPAGAAPAFLMAGLDEARNALAQAETDLATLLGSATPAPAAESMAAPTASAPSLDHSQAAADETVAAPPLSGLPDVPAAETTPITPPPAAPPPHVAGPRILIVEGNHELFLPTDKAEIIVGREDPVSQIYPEIDLTSFGGEMGGVSRQHARITHSNGQWAIIDLNSTNYTRVNGTRIEPNTPTPIHDGAQLQFGRIAAVFHTT